MHTPPAVPTPTNWNVVTDLTGRGRIFLSKCPYPEKNFKLELPKTRKKLHDGLLPHAAQHAAEHLRVVGER